jgi:serine/threonine protein kinase
VLTSAHTPSTLSITHSPAQVLANQRYSSKADVYSFGVVVWECCARTVPYEGMNGVQAAMAVVNRWGQQSVGVMSRCLRRGSAQGRHRSRGCGPAAPGGADVGRAWRPINLPRGKPGHMATRQSGQSAVVGPPPLSFAPRPHTRPRL